jgi:hypothetical protein
MSYPELQPEPDLPQGTRSDNVILQPEPVRTDRSLRQERVMTGPGIEIRTAFYWPETPKEPTAGYTAPLVEWEQTTITGLTAQPIVLAGWYSQTYSPGHHNFYEEFVFEPGLEPGLSAEQRAELDSADIRLLLVGTDGQTSQFRVLGRSGPFRPLR